MTKYLRPLLAVCTFVAVQAITCTVVYVLLILECMRETAARTGGSMFSASSYPNVLPELTVGNTVEILVVSSLVTLILLAGVLHLVRFPHTFDARSVHWPKVPAVLVGSAAGILAVSLFSEFFDLPDFTGGSLTQMMDSLPGILAVGVLGPILEEVVFREALLGGMFAQRVSPWKAILISAFVFGAVHFNPAQFPAAFCIGLLLGVVYWKTGNIVVTSIIHMANNLLCVALVRGLGDAADTFSLGQWMGGGMVPLVVAGLSLLLCVGMFAVFIRTYPQVATPEDYDDDLKYI